MANTLGLFFKIGADDSGVDAALKALKQDLSTVDTEIKKLARTLNILPSEARELVESFSHIEDETKRAAIALQRFGDAGLKALPNIETLGKQLADVSKRQADLAGASTSSAKALENMAQRGVGQLTQALGPLGNLLDEVAVSLGSIGVAVVGITAGLAAAGKAWLDYAGQVHDATLETNLSAEAISGLSIIAKTGGVSLDELNQAWVRLQRSAVEGGHEAREALKRFGLEPRQVIGDLEGSIDTFLERFNEIGPSAQRTTDLMTLFGRSAAQLTPAFEDAAGGLQELINKAREWNILMDQEAIKKADDFGDAIGIAELQFKGFVVTIGSFVIPALQKLDQVFTDVRNSMFGQTAEFLRRIKQDINEIAGKLPRAPGIGLGVPLALDPKALAALAESQADFNKQTKNTATAVRATSQAMSEADREAERLAADVQKAADSYEKLIFELGVAKLTVTMTEISNSINQQVLAQQAANAALERFIELSKQAAQVPLALPKGAPGALEGLKTVPGLELDLGLSEAIGEEIRKAKEASQLGLEEITQQWQIGMEILADVLGPFAAATQQAFSAFILTGRAAGLAFKKLVADIISGLAVQSAVKALFELAEGWAASAVGLYAQAAMHFKAAAIYGTVSAVAAATGLAIGAAGGLGGGGGEGQGAGAGFGGTPAPVTINQGNAAQLGVRPDVVLFSDAVTAIGKLEARISSMRPEDVLTVGARNRPEAVTDATLEVTRRSSSFAREFYANSGMGS